MFDPSLFILFPSCFCGVFGLTIFCFCWLRDWCETIVFAGRMPFCSLFWLLKFCFCLILFFFVAKQQNPNFLFRTKGTIQALLSKQTMAEQKESPAESEKKAVGKGKFADPKAKHRKEDFELGGLLGGGAFAKVVEGKVTNEDSPFFGKEFAVKILDKRHIVKNDKIKYVNIERDVFVKTRKHPFMCHMHFSFQDPYSLC